MVNSSPRHPYWCDLFLCTINEGDTTGSHVSRTVTVVDGERTASLQLVRFDARTDADRQAADPGYRPTRLLIERLEVGGATVSTVQLSTRQGKQLGRIMAPLPAPWTVMPSDSFNKLVSSLDTPEDAEPQWLARVSY